MSLIEKVRFWARHNSVRLAAVAGPIASVAVSYPHETLQLLDGLPAPLRAIGAFVVLTVLPIWARTKPQASLSKPNGQ
jgi:hypothetical protein